MKTLFLFLYLIHHPAFDPCGKPADIFGMPGFSSTMCLAVPARPAWSEQQYALFETRDEALGFIRKEGKEGQLIDLTTRQTEQIYVKPVMKKVKETVEKEVVDGYEIVTEGLCIQSACIRSGHGTVTIQGGRIQ